MHVSRATRKFITESKINIIKWPPYSPDLNIAEDVWKKLSDMVYDGPQFNNKHELGEKIKKSVDELNSSNTAFVQQLYQSIRRRLCTVIERHGDLCNK